MPGKNSSYVLIIFEIVELTGAMGTVNTSCSAVSHPSFSSAN
jgi:hypothetical protein